MVTVSLEPPPSSFTPRAARRARAGPILAVLAVVLAGGGGFWLGRKTAPKADPAAAASARPNAAPVAPSAAPVQASQNAATPAPVVPGVPGAVSPGGGAGAPVAPPAQPAGAISPTGGAVRRIAFALSGPLEESIAVAVPQVDRPIAEELTQVVNRLLVWDLQVSRDGRRGDRVEILYRPAEAAAPGLPASGEPVVEALRYASQKLGRVVAAYRFQAAGARWARYYRADGTEVEERLVGGPISEYDQVTSLLRDGRRHKGVDFRTPVGTPVASPVDGVIERRNWNFAGNGNCLDLRDLASGRHAIFLHLEPLPKEMAVGRRVKKGEVIASSGNSGHSTAPHLHYQLEAPDGRILDPFAVHAVRRAALEGGVLGTFGAERTKLDAALGPLDATAAAALAPVPVRGRRAR